MNSRRAGEVVLDVKNISLRFGGVKTARPLRRCSLPLGGTTRSVKEAN